MVNDFDAQAANQIPKIIANETVDEVELVRQNNSGLSGICSRVTLAVVKAEKALPLLRQVSVMSKSTRGSTVNLSTCVSSADQGGGKRRQARALLVLV